MRRTRRRRIEETPTVMLTSMTDMFTLILVFLLHFIDPAMSADPTVQLPSAATTDAAAEGITLTITPDAVRLNAKTVFGLSGGQVPATVERDGKLIVPLYDALGAVQKQPAGTGTEEPLLRVECDKSVPYTVVSDALHTAGSAGFGRFQLVVIQKE